MKVRSSQVECSIECCLLGEQEQSHSAGTDIIDYRRWCLLWKIIIYMEKFLDTDWLRAVQSLVNAKKLKKKFFSENEKMWLAHKE